jgi:outer membrane protein assembly factor BamE
MALGVLCAGKWEYHATPILEVEVFPMRILLISLAITCISACTFVGFPGVYKLNIEQGNIVTQEMTDQLKPGMTRRQVRFILGTPLVEDTFHPDRWDYIYVKRNGREVLDESRLTVEFEGDNLASLSGDMVPPTWNAKGSTSKTSSPLPEPAPGIPTDQ